MPDRYIIVPQKDISPWDVTYLVIDVPALSIVPASPFFTKEAAEEWIATAPKGA